MSRWNDVLGALETLVRAATTTPSALPAGTDGWERAIRPPDRLHSGQFPHVFSDVLSEDEVTLPHGQRRVTTRIVLHLVTQGETLDNIETRLDAIETALLASNTLGGLVRDVAIASKAIGDATSVGDAKRSASLTLEAWRVL